MPQGRQKILFTHKNILSCILLFKFQGQFQNLKMPGQNSHQTYHYWVLNVMIYYTFNSILTTCSFYSLLFSKEIPPMFVILVITMKGLRQKSNLPSYRQSCWHLKWSNIIDTDFRASTQSSWLTGSSNGPVIEKN